MALEHDALTGFKDIIPGIGNHFGSNSLLASSAAILVSLLAACLIYQRYIYGKFQRNDESSNVPFDRETAFLNLRTKIQQRQIEKREAVAELSQIVRRSLQEALDCDSDGAPLEAQTVQEIESSLPVKLRAAIPSISSSLILEYQRRLIDWGQEWERSRFAPIEDGEKNGTTGELFWDRLESQMKEVSVLLREIDSRRQREEVRRRPIVEDNGTTTVASPVENPVRQAEREVRR